MNNKEKLEVNNENLLKIIAELDGLPSGGVQLNIATQDGVLIGTLTKDEDGFDKMQPAEDPWAEIDAQEALLTAALDAMAGAMDETNATPETVLEGFTAFSKHKYIVGKAKAGLDADFGTVTLSKTENNSEREDFTISHNLGKVPENFWFFPSNNLVYPDGYLNGESFSGSVISICNEKAFRVTRFSNNGGAIYVTETRAEISADENTVHAKIVNGTDYRFWNAFYRGTFIWVVM